MRASDLYVLLSSVGKATMENLPDILKTLPVYGETLSKLAEAAMQGVADYRAKKISAEEYAHRKQPFDDAAKKEAQKAKPPAYMDCVIFRCRSGIVLSEEQQMLLAEALEEGGTDFINEFVQDYMGGSVSEGDDYCIGDDYVGLNFWYDEHSHSYDADALRQMMDALNEQLGCDALDYFVASGHDEDYEKD